MKNQRKAGFVLSYISIFVSSVIGIAFTPYMIAQLGKDEYGLYQLLYAVIGYFSLLDFGLGGTLTRFILKYKAEGDNKKVKSVITMFVKIYCTIGLSVLIITFIGSYFLENLFHASINGANLTNAKIVFIIMGATTALSFVRHALSGIQSAEEQYVVMKLVVIAQHIFRMILILILLHLGVGAIGVAFADLIVTSILLLFDMYYCKFVMHYNLMKGKWNTPLFKALFTFSVFVFLQIIVTQINNGLDRIILGRYATLELVALYGVAMQLYNLFNSLGGVIAGITLPQVSKVVFSGADVDKTTNCCAHYSRYQLHISALLLGGFLVLGKHFISIWTPGYDSTQVYVIVLLIVVPQFLESVEGTVFNVMKAKNLQTTRSLILVGVAVLHIILSVILVHMMPVYGTALGTCISFVIGNNILSNIYYHKKVGVNMIQYFKKLFDGILPAWCLVQVIGLAIAKLPLSGWIGFAIKGLCYSIVYIIVFYYIGINQSEKALVHTCLKKLKLKK